MPPDPHSTASAAPRPRRAALRLALRAGAVLGVLLVLMVVLFVAGIPVPGDFARSPLEGLLTKVFRVPTRIEGPLRLRTGLVASAEADALVLADPLNPDGPPLARAIRPSVRIDLKALLRRAVKLGEMTAERGEIMVTRGAGRSNWDPVFARSGRPAPVRFAGIGALRIASVDVSYRGEGASEPMRFEVQGFDATLPEREPATARGTLSITGRTLAIDASSASIAVLQASTKSIPLQATIELSNARLELNGAYVPADAALEGAVELAAENADAALAAVGLAARGAGKLEARGRLRLTGAEASVSDLAFRLGKGSVAGSVGFNWRGGRPRFVFDLSGERVDLRPFTSAAGLGRGANWLEDYVEFLDTLAHQIDLDGKVAVGEYVGLFAESLGHTRVEVRIADSVLAVRANGDVVGMQITGAIDYSAREPKRSLAMRMTGGRFSTEKLPGAERPSQLSGTLGGLRFELKGAGANTHELAKSIRMKLDSRDLRFSWAHRGGRPTEVYLDSAGLEVAQGRSARAEVRGKLGGRPCSLRVSGGTLASLLEGQRWPLKLDASCRGAKLVSKGHIVLKGPSATGALQFNASANPVGPFVEPFGLSGDAPLALTSSGEFSLTEDLAHVQLNQIRLGRSGGAAMVSFYLEGKRAPQVKIAFAHVDGTELAALAPGAGKQAPADPLAREVLAAKTRLPDLDLELSVNTVRLFGETLRRVSIDAAPRDGALPPARLGLTWRGTAVSGVVSADFRGARPTLELSAAAQNADLGAALAHAGYTGPALRAGTIRASARGAGIKLGELLGSATAEASIEQGQLKNVRRFVPGLAGDAGFSAKLVVAEGQPLKLAASGSAGDLPFNVAIETAPLMQLARRQNGLPGTLRASLGETRLEASGKVTLEGTEDLRLTLSGEHLDRLGRLAAVKLPEVGPYAFGASVVIAPDSIRVSDLNVKFGKSSVLGKVSVKRGGERLAHAAELRAPVLHLEDLGLHVFFGTAGKSGDEAGDAKQFAEIAKMLRAFDANATLDVEALFGEGKHHASLKTKLMLQGGNLDVSLQDVQLSGGKAQADLHVEARASRPRLRLRVLAERFEFGRLAEALKPKTPLEGTLDLLLDLTIDGLQKPLLGSANGYVDSVIYPRGLKLGAADYWGTGLLHTLQLSVDTAATSKLNCAVGVFNIKNGLASSQAFFSDTTRVRIIGELQANLATRELSGRITPNSKNPALFAVSPSLGIAGTMESPRVTVTPESLIIAPLRFVLPIHAFALDWLRQTGVPADDSAGCRKAFEQAREAASKKPAAPAGMLQGIYPF